MSRPSGEIKLEWEAPPEAPTKDDEYAPVFAEVRKRPGSWARVRLMRSGGYTAAKRLRKRYEHDPHWEIKAAQVSGDGEFTVGLYVRYRTDEQLRAVAKRR